VEAALGADVPVWLHGETGSGKSTSGQLAAGLLGLSFRSISLGPTTSKSDLLGYRDATGRYHNTGFRKIYEDGGVFLFDEIDNAHPSILTLTNSAIANGYGEFPDGRVDRHEATRFISTANTIGRGATAEYVGRAPIDMATIDRYAFVPMDIDPALEESLLDVVELPDDHGVDISEGDVPDRREWLAIVRANRAAAGELGIRTLVSPRAAIYGMRLAAVGVGKVWLQRMLIYKGMAEQDRDRLQKLADQKIKTIKDSQGRLLVEQKDDDNTTPDSQEPQFDIARHINKHSGHSSPVGSHLESALTRLGHRQRLSRERIQLVTALLWQLEKAHGVTCLSVDQDRNAINLLKSREATMAGLSEEISAQKFIETLTEQEVARDFLTQTCNMLPSSTRIYKSILEQLLSDTSTITSQIDKLQKEFEDRWSFCPGPFSLAHWLVYEGRTSYLYAKGK